MAEIVRAAIVGGIVLKLAQQHARIEDVIAHGSEDAIRVAGNRGRIGFLFVEAHNTPVGPAFDDAEIRRQPFFGGDGRHGQGRVLLFVVFDHGGDVHAVNVIGAEDGHDVRVRLLDQIDVLEYGVGGSLVPGFVGRAHLRRHGNDELVLQKAAELPGFVEVLQQRLAAELGKHVKRIDSRIDEVAQHEVDDAILSSEGNRWFGALFGERVEPGAFASGQDDAEHTQSHIAGYCVSRVPGPCNRVLS